MRVLGGDLKISVAEQEPSHWFWGAGMGDTYGDAPPPSFHPLRSSLTGPHGPGWFWVQLFL